jgi:hypothetical protein
VRISNVEYALHLSFLDNKNKETSSNWRIYLRDIGEEQGGIIIVISDSNLA